jgi:glycerophosphoryl diester phosphodiesterase
VVSAPVVSKPWRARRPGRYGIVEGVIFTAKPEVVGHRGCGRGTSGRFRENTVESCLAAVEAGLTWLEIDAQRTADDELVLRHDWTAPDGSPVLDRTAADLSAQGIARLAEIFDAVPADIAIDIDVKTVLADAADQKSRRTGTLLATALSAESRRRRLLVTSFDPGLLVALRPELPGVALGLITWLHFPPQHGIPAAAGLGLDAVCLHTGSMRPASAPQAGAREDPHRYPTAADAVSTAHEAGLEVLIWCPGASAAASYAAAGADALCVDDVPGTLAALAS